jgi:hypothetical protein
MIEISESTQSDQRLALAIDSVGYSVPSGEQVENWNGTFGSM